MASMSNGSGGGSGSGGTRSGHGSVGCIKGLVDSPCKQVIKEINENMAVLYA